LLRLFVFVKVCMGVRLGVLCVNCDVRKCVCMYVCMNRVCTCRNIVVCFE